MGLPKVAGWLIDFRTANSIFSSGSNARISHCTELCENRLLFASHCERANFKRVPLVKATFVDHKCLFTPDIEIMLVCDAIASSPLGRNLVTGNDAAVFLAGIATCKTFGVISDHRSPVYTTIFDLCRHFHVPVFSADEYFEHLG